MGVRSFLEDVMRSVGSLFRRPVPKPVASRVRYKQGARPDSSGDAIAASYALDYGVTIAFGIHKGSTGGDDCDRLGAYAHFSSVGEVEQFLGVDLLHRQTVRFLG